MVSSSHWPRLCLWFNPLKLLSLVIPPISEFATTLCLKTTSATATLLPSPVKVPTLFSLRYPPVRSKRELGAMHIDLSIVFGTGLLIVTPLLKTIIPAMRDLDREVLYLSALQAASNTPAAVARMDISGRLEPEDVNIAQAELQRLADSIALTTNEGFCALASVINPSTDECGAQVIYNSAYDRFYSNSFIPQGASGKYCGRKWTYASLPAKLKESMLKGHGCERRVVIGIVMFRDPEVHLVIPANIDPT